MVLPFLSDCRDFEFEMVAGHVKYSGPQQARTTRLTPKFQIHRLELPLELAGRRLDQALAQLLPQYSRTRIQHWIEAGAVLVNGLVPRARDVVTGGETAASKPGSRSRPPSQRRSCRSTSSTRMRASSC